MAEPDDLLDADFDSQLRGLFEEAEQALQGRSARSEEQPAQRLDHQGTPSSSSPPNQLLRPLLLELEALSRATGENTVVLARLDRGSSAASEAQQELPKIAAALRALLETKNGVSHSMFNALHEELKGYKDGFLLESVQRPIIRDLIMLYDDCSEIRRQLAAALQEHASDVNPVPQEAGFVERIRGAEVHLEHNIEFVLEILARLSVSPLPDGCGKLDKQSQRAVALEPAASPHEDSTIVRSVKRGFAWREKMIRPEEVIIKRWTEPDPDVSPPEPGAGAATPSPA